MYQAAFISHIRDNLSQDCFYPKALKQDLESCIAFKGHDNDPALLTRLTRE